MAVPHIKFYEPEDPVFGLLSNYAETPFSISNYGVFPTVEHYFQSRKFFIFNEPYSDLIINAPTPLKASILGSTRKIEGLDPHWEKFKEPYMSQAISYKLACNYNVRQALLSTVGRILIYNNTRDSFWGIGSGKGQNIIGKLYMHYRERLIKFYVERR